MKFGFDIGGLVICITSTLLTAHTSFQVIVNFSCTYHDIDLKPKNNLIMQGIVMTIKEWKIGVWLVQSTTTLNSLEAMEIHQVDVKWTELNLCHMEIGFTENK